MTETRATFSGQAFALLQVVMMAQALRVAMASRQIFWSFGAGPQPRTDGYGGSLCALQIDIIKAHSDTI
ncbi:hypothetical protein [Novosphingobium profundi]|uniref:hypothetical protein n=1 Tax=Novosphingobium profundi TaxID=1774954 RepID=UPI001CFF1E16|nr:hypothetical protein [Novosphingobium profundi]